MIGKTLLRDVFLLLPSGKTERGAIAFDDTGILALGKNETVLSEHRTGARIISTSSSGRYKGNASSKDSCLNATFAYPRGRDSR